MHKRGYKHGDHAAPLKETLAAALLLELGYDGSQVLLDPMCGSGTLGIEAAMISLRKAPLIHRKKDEFGFERLKILNREMWRAIQDDARKDKLQAIAQPIYMSDIDPKSVSMAQANALRARVEKYLNFAEADFFNLTPPTEQGMLIMNLPYGERLGTDVDLEDFYARVGTRLKREYSGWTAALLVAEDAPIAKIGLKPKRKISILNGSLPCKFLVFEIFAGKRKDFVIQRETTRQYAPIKADPRAGEIRI